jgi:hypothetical protein
MTLILAFKLTHGEGEAVLVASDSKATAAFGIAYEVKKIRPIRFKGSAVGIVSGAGDSALVKAGFKLADDILVRYAEKEYPVSHDAFARAAEEVQSGLLTKFSQLRGLNLDPDFRMILCGLDLSGKASIYSYDGRGLSEPVHENPGYAMIGSGFVTGGVLLLKLLGYTPDVGLDGLGLMSTFILDNVSEVDTAVGPFVGECYLMRIEHDKGSRQIFLGALKDEALVEYKRKASSRRDLLRMVWKASDRLGEEKVRELLGPPHEKHTSVAVPRHMHKRKRKLNVS